MKQLNILFVAILLFIGTCAFGQRSREYIVTITTDFGKIDLVLFNQTPKHKENFLKLANEGFYNGTTFHRIIKGFMIQGGDINSKDQDPNNDGMGNVGYTIPAEFVDGITHIKGAVAAARMGDGVNPKRESSGSQFYIVEGNDGAHFLDGQYTVFGQVISGIDVVTAIASQPKSRSDRPDKNITMQVSVTKSTVKKIKKKYGYIFPETKKSE